MKKRKLIINYLYIENSYIYKHKDLLKTKDNKYIINYNNLLDKTLDKNLKEDDKKILITSLIVKKLKKILLKNNYDELNIYYVLSSFEESKIINLNRLIANYFIGDIVNNIYTDYKDVPKGLFANHAKPEYIKNDSQRNI